MEREETNVILLGSAGGVERRDCAPPSLRTSGRSQDPEGIPGHMLLVDRAATGNLAPDLSASHWGKA